MTSTHKPSLARFRPGRNDLRALWQLALPIVVVQVGIMLMGVVDTIMIGRLSAQALAAVAVGNMYFWGASIFGMGVIMALDPLISQAVGASDEPAIARAVQRGFMIAVVLTLLNAVYLSLAAPVLEALRQPAEIIPDAALFARIMIPGTLPLFAFTVARQSLQSMSIVAPVVIGIIIANVINFGLNWLLIFGNLGFPALGVAGSAWATTFSRFLLLGIVVALTFRKLKPYIVPFRREALQLGPLVLMLRLGAPIGVHHMLEYGAFAAVMIFMGILGTVQVASHQIAINLASLTFMVPFGIAQAGSVLVGQAVGRGMEAEARRAAGTAVVCGVSFMMLTAILFLVLPMRLAAIYTTDVAVLALAVQLIRLAGVFQVFDGLQVVATGVLRGVGDTRVPMFMGLIGFWIFGMPVSIWLGMVAKQGAVGLWWGLVTGLAIVGVFLIVRVYQRLGRHLVRIDVDRPATFDN